MHKSYWLIGRHSTRDLVDKRLFYVAIIKPSWDSIGVQLWGCTGKSNIQVIHRCQSTALRTIVGAYRFDRKTVRRELKTQSVQDEIEKFY